MLRTTAVSEQETVVSAPLLSPPVTTERRYDPKTIEKAVALASKMQADHQETLSSGEIEAIAAEAGIRPDFMRRALALMEQEQIAAPVQTTPVVKTSVRKTRTLSGKRRLTRRQKTLIFGAPALYTLIALPILALMAPGLRGGNNAAVFVFFLFLLGLPSLLSLSLGINLPRKRQGAVAGALTGFGVALAALSVSSDGGGPGPGPFLGVLMIFLFGGGFLGLAGTWLKKNMPLWLGALSADDETTEEGALETLTR